GGLRDRLAVESGLEGLPNPLVSHDAVGCVQDENVVAVRWQRADHDVGITLKGLKLIGSEVDYKVVVSSLHSGYPGCFIRHRNEFSLLQIGRLAASIAIWLTIDTNIISKTTYKDVTVSLSIGKLVRSSANEFSEWVRSR